MRGKLLQFITAAVFIFISLHAFCLQATQTYTTPPSDLIQKINDSLNKQDYPTARKLLLTLTGRNPKDATLLYNLGFTDEALNDEPAAATAYRQSIAANTTYFDPHLALGLLLARQGKLPEAHAELAQAVTLTTHDTALKARAYRALARLDQPTDPTAATASLLAALKLSPETDEDTLLAAELAETAHDPAAAEAAYRRILAARAASPETSAATAALAHLLLTLKRAPEAETLLTAALAQRPDDPALTSQLAAAEAAQGKTAEAIALIEKLHAAAPGNANITRLLAHLYSDDKQPGKAAPLYAALLAQSPNDPQLLADQGETQLHLHNYPEAERLLQLATADPKAFPSPADVGSTLEKLAFAASHNNDPQTVLQAVSLYATVLAKSPVILFLEATAHDTLHHRKEAAALYKQFLAAAAGKYPDQEWEASHRLIALGHMK